MNSAESLKINLDKKGHDVCGSYSFPLRPAVYHQVVLPGIEIHFMPGWRPIFFQGTRDGWPHPMEWIRVGLSGSKAYYSSMGYGGLACLFQQFYVPVPLEEDTTLAFFNPATDPEVKRTIELYRALPQTLREACQGPSALSTEASQILHGILRWQRFHLYELPRILRCKVNVLPPDSMMCDYHVFPVIVSTGCPYNCGFCKVKDGTDFVQRPQGLIEAQVRELAQALAPELHLFKGVFLGNQDALLSREELIFFAIELARKVVPKAKNYFLFGSVDALLAKETDFFKALNSLGVDCYINIGLESLDGATLQALKKPLTPHLVKTAWEKISHLNKTLDRVEISLNILASTRFPDSHWNTLEAQLSKDGPCPKGPIYLSVYNDSIGRKFFDLAKRVKISTNRPVGIYNLIGL
ncbi:MAG: radical SAM protein [Thermodesulfobacteria bacterium]|nr:radical SAM protein [Thermodesulfobacteriota bacterium]